MPPCRAPGERHGDLLVEFDAWAINAAVRQQLPQPQTCATFVTANRAFVTARFDDPRMRESCVWVAGYIHRAPAPEHDCVGHGPIVRHVCDDGASVESIRRHRDRVEKPASATLLRARFTVLACHATHRPRRSGHPCTTTALPASRLASFDLETVAEQAVMPHEKRCAGQRRGAESSMARRRVLTTVSRSSAFPGCGAVSKSNEASWLLNVHAYPRRTDDPIAASTEIAWKSAALRNAARDPRWAPNPARQSRCGRALPLRVSRDS